MITTRRCVLRPVVPDDGASLHAVWSSPGVRRYLWDGAAIPVDRTREAIERSVRMFEERRFGLWGAWSLEASQPTMRGFGGLWPFRDPPEIELLYGVAEEYWGKGYATEIAGAIVAYCSGTLGIRVVRASTDAANAASIQVLEKLGFSFVRRSTVAGLDTVFYELTSPG